MSEQDGWSAPALYSGRGLPVEPRTFTEADPIAAMLLADWPADGAGVQWSPTRYVGPRRLRPGTVPAARTIDARRQPAEVPDATAAAPGAASTDGSAAAEAAASDRGVMSSSRTMAIASLISRATGFLRSVLLVAALGTTGVGNSYSGGNTFPNMVYELLLGGVLSSVLIPLLVKAQAEDDDDGTAYTQRLLSIATAALAVLTLVAVACAPLIAGYFAEPGERSLTTVFATLLLPEIFFYGLGAMFMAVLNIKHSYGPGAWAPVLNNVIMIVTVLVFWLLPGPAALTPGSITTAQILVIGIGTTVGIAAQALVLVPALRAVGFSWRWRFRASSNEVGRVREMGTLAGWVFGYVIASQIGVTVIQKIGFRNGGLTIFTQADLLFQVPYGILVVSLLTAIMPRMSRAAVRADSAAVVRDLALGSRLSVLAMVPITVGLLVLGPDLGVTLFAHGQTSLAHARLLGQALAASAFGLVFFAVVMLQLRVFYAMHDGRTPTVINVFMVGAKVALVLGSNAAYGLPVSTRTDPLPSVGAIVWLNVATSLSYVVGALVGHLLLRRRLGGLGYRSVAVTFGRILAASAVGGGAAYAVVRGLHAALGTAHAGAVSALVGGAVVGAGALAAVCVLGRFPEVRELRAMVGR
jgi:putative peptidoglycan lipid II flippase